MTLLEASLIFLLLFVLIALGYFIVLSGIFEKRYKKVQDKYLSLAMNKKLLVPGRFMRKDEQTFLEKLYAVLNSNDYYIAAQVHISDIVDVKSSHKDHDNLYFELGQKSVDYVVFEKKEFKIIVAIELNGASHFYQGQAKNRDKLVEDIFKNVDIPFLPYPKEKMHDEHFLRNALTKYLL